VVAERYSTALAGRYSVPFVPENQRSAWAQYSIVSDSRKEIMSALKSKGVPTMIYYPKPLHLQKAFASLGYEKGQLPIAEEVAENVFSIPMHPYLDEKEQEIIINELMAF
jgi:UDP-2-acetamido-2-deoxy-ribo-hexuluronate aminotransferase